MVISIIGMLVSVAAVAFGETQKRSRDSRRIQDVKNLQKAMEQYNTINGKYTGISGTACNTGTELTKWYPSGIPLDPQTQVAYSVTNCSSGTTYCFCAKLESSAVANASDNNCTYSGNLVNYCVSQLQ